MAVTPKNPSGLYATREANVFTLTWKQGETYSRQEIMWAFNGAFPKTPNGSITESDTEYVVTVDESTFYPGNIKKKYTTFQFKVRGFSVRANKWSGWVTYSYKLIAPNAPIIKRDGNSYQFTASENYTAGKGDPYLVDIVYEVCHSTTAVQKSVVWKVSKTTTDYAQYTCENGDSTTVSDTNGSVTWVRAASRGPAGQSAWVYLSRVFRAPLAVKDLKGSMIGADASVTFTPQVTAERPADYLFVQYAIDTPLSGNVCPAGVTWHTSNDKLLTSSKKASFSLGQRVPYEKNLWVRVGTYYDPITSFVTYTDAKFIKGGDLTAPTLISVDVDETERSAVVTWRDNSVVPDSKIAVVFTDGTVLKTFAHGVTTGTVRYSKPADPNQSIQFGVYAYQGASATSPNMKSATTFATGQDIPLAPTSLAVTIAEGKGIAHLAWENAWTEADGAELSWANHADAWRSTDSPKRFEIEESATEWNVAGLTTGEEWYFRVRSTKDNDGSTTYSPYTDIATLSLASAPGVPALMVSDNVIIPDQTFTVTWAYVSTDDTEQAGATIFAKQKAKTDKFVGDGTTASFVLTNTPDSITLVTVDGEATSDYTLSESTVIMTTAPEEGVTVAVAYAMTGVQFELAEINGSAQSLMIAPGWEYGSQYELTIITESTNGYISNESNAVTVTVSEEPTISSLANSISSGITDGVLTELPLAIDVVGAGSSGKTVISIERVGDYHMERPDESTADGFDGETVYAIAYQGEGRISIAADDLTGALDDGASYRLTATITNANGQSASGFIDFSVAWAHQAEVPTAEVTVDRNNLICKIKPIAPTGAIESDVCDIYRLSVDLPELIVSGGTFGTTYVDPFPAYNGGYRVVTRTANGDYIADNVPAWSDYDIDLTFAAAVIDFGSQRVELPYNVDLDNSWSKNFIETRYLNGHTTGDWNVGYSRRATINTASVQADADTAYLMRRLSVFTGICHIRTADGSSFAADVQVRETQSYESNATSFSLSITRVDPEGFDGVPLSVWES